METRTIPAGRPATAADVTEFLGPIIAPIIAQPDDIVIYRIDPDKSKKQADQPTIAGYPIKRMAGKAGEVQKAAWSKYASAPEGFSFMDDRLRNPNSSMARGCSFQPGIALIFSRGEAHCTVLICFSCSQWKFLGPDNDASRSDYFDPLSGKIRALAQTAFPDDPAFAPRPSPPAQP